MSIRYFDNCAMQILLVSSFEIQVHNFEENS